LEATFDAAKARCFLTKDREHLRAVIEAGVGDFDDFNRIARSLLVRRVLPHEGTAAAGAAWSSSHRHQVIDLPEMRFSFRVTLLDRSVH
jgi:hypothetical protein